MRFNIPFVPAKHHGGPQDRIDYIVMHSMVMECKPGAAMACAKYFASQSDANPTSAHYNVDPAEVVQSVHDMIIAYHCGHNYRSIGVEMADMSTDDLARWNDANHKAMLERTAHLVARLCIKHNVRPYYVSWIGLKFGRKGVTTHAQMTLAFHQSTHTDPNAWPRKHFMRMVRAEIKSINGSK